MFMFIYLLLINILVRHTQTLNYFLLFILQLKKNKTKNKRSAF